MSILLAEALPYLKYIAPPVVGAFIGYLTNRVAIKMLFRPLKPWHVLGVRIPMTPGVIPSQRHRLAENMGEVVGDHLLTSGEISKALAEGKFQQHLLSVIAERVGQLLHRDLPAVQELVPKKFQLYLNLTVLTIKQQLRESIRSFMKKDTFRQRVESAIAEKFDDFTATRANDLIGKNQRESVYNWIEATVSHALASDSMQVWLNEFIKQQVHDVIKQDKSISEMLPAPLLSTIEDGVRSQTPKLLKRLASILKEPEVRDGIVRGTCTGVENFIVSLGPMAPMVQNFITIETVELKIREYLDEKEDDIIAWLSSDEFQIKVADILTERYQEFSRKPLSEILKTTDIHSLDNLCDSASRQIFELLQANGIAKTVASVFKHNVESHFLSDDLSVHELATELLGTQATAASRKWFQQEGVRMLHDDHTLKTIDGLVDDLVDVILQRKIGKLSNFLPADVRKEVYVSIRDMANGMLEKEVPGIVDSLDIRTIIGDKINSLDLLRLERLLLSIMEEQFKYINLFGALLGFIIGLINCVVLFLG